MNVNEFINNHHYTNYCEAIIYPNGDIEYAEPGHLYKLIDITKKSKDELDQIIPDMAAPLEYLLGYTKCISVWYNWFMYDSISDEQLNTLQQLVNSDILFNGIPGNFTDEFTRCNLLQKFYNNEITHDEILKEKEQKSIRIWRK